jgi:hypothetical protein
MTKLLRVLLNPLAMWVYGIVTSKGSINVDYDSCCTQWRYCGLVAMSDYYQEEDELTVFLVKFWIMRHEVYAISFAGWLDRLYWYIGGLVFRATHPEWK